MYGQLKINTGLSRKFPMPESLKERANALILFGIAIFCAAIFDPARDFFFAQNGQSTIATLYKTDQFQNSGPKRNIGIYSFKDSIGSSYFLVGKKIYGSKDLVPKTAKVAWPLGSPNKAKILWQFSYLTHLIWAMIGVLMAAFGVILRKKAKEE